MIHLEYDPVTDGIRVSFVVRKGEMSVAGRHDTLYEQGTRHGECKRSHGTWVIPQNAETLEAVKKLLDLARKCE